MTLSTTHSTPKVSPRVRDAVREALPKLAATLAAKYAQGAEGEKVQTVLSSLEQLGSLVGAEPVEITGAFDAAYNEATARLRFESPKVSHGKITKVVFRPGKISETAGYALVEVSDLVASHHPDCSLNTDHTISGAQPRDRSAKELCRQADKIAASLDPAIIAGLGASAFDGPPVVNQRLEAIQGNGRSIALIVAYERYPKQADAYRRYLAANADAFGFEEDEVRVDFKRPVLVRLMEVTDERAVELGNVLNTAEAEQAPLDRAKALVRGLTDPQRRTLGRELGDLIGRAGDDATLRAALDHNTAPDLLDFFPGLDRSGLLKGGALTTRGKDLLRDLFIGLLFDDGTPGSTARYEALSHTAQRGIERSMGSLIPLVGTDHDLGPRLRAAAEIVRRGKASGLAVKRAADVLDQQDVFASERFTKDDGVLADLLMSASTQSEIVGRFAAYARLAEGYTTLFESVPPQPPADAFRRAFVERENPSAVPVQASADLAYLGTLDSLTVAEDGSADELRIEEDGEPIYLFQDGRGRVIAVGSDRVQPMRGPVGGDGASLYETWAGRPEDADTFAIDFSGTEEHFKRLARNGQTTQRLGTGVEIVYRSDKLVEPGDRKDEPNTYRHRFDPGQRPVYQSGPDESHIFIISDLAIDRRGILN